MEIHKKIFALSKLIMFVLNILMLTYYKMSLETETNIVDYCFNKLLQWLRKTLGFNGELVIADRQPSFSSSKKKHLCWGSCLAQ